MHAQAASQLDIAPTVADLLQLHDKSHFVGRSLVSGDTPRPVPLVQPYDGVRLCAVSWPYKLVRHEAAEQEQLYDLAQDPSEDHDLLADGAHPPALAQLRRTILELHANQALLRRDRIWPATAQPGVLVRSTSYADEQMRGDTTTSHTD